MLALALVAVGAALRLDAVSRSRAGLSPISRVAQLLEGLSQKVQQDEKAEQGLYDQYKCWCDKVINGKRASMDANELRIAELAAYIDDLDNGRVELTDERSTQEAEVKELTTAIADAEALRANELADYTAAKSEMDMAVAALASASYTLGNATEDNPEALLASRYTTQLRKAVSVGKGFLAKADVDGLLHELDVPAVDYEKLNRKGLNAQNYTTRSGEIQGILADMLATFRDNRADAVQNEQQAASDHDTLIDAKKDQLGAAKQALLDKSGEGDARGVAKSESETEKGDLEGQNTRDTTFVSDTETACDTKATEWAERRRLRQAEIASINKALTTLRSDDARDLMSKRDARTTHKAALFLQLSAARAPMAAVRALRAAGVRDARVTAIATRLALLSVGNLTATNPFDDVLDQVDNMVSALRTEAADDASKRDDCESAQVSNTQDAKRTSKAVDLNTENIDTENAAIAAHKKGVAEADAQLALIASLKKDSEDQRAAEAKEYAEAKADDEEAVGLIEAAVKTLQDFYTDNIDLLQQGVEPGAGGEDPGDAPVTWGDGADAAYGGASASTGGINSILGMIKTDIESDLADAGTAEAAAISAHTQLLADLGTTKGAIETTKGDLEADVATAEGTVATETGDRTANQGDLQSTLGALDAMSEGCNYLRQHFEPRRLARQSEIDGLTSARRVLSNANEASR